MLALNNRLPPKREPIRRSRREFRIRDFIRISPACTGGSLVLKASRHETADFYCRSFSARPDLRDGAAFSGRRGFLNMSPTSVESAPLRHSCRIGTNLCFFPCDSKNNSSPGRRREREREREGERESPLGENQRVSLILPLFGDARGRRCSSLGAFILSFVIQVVSNYGTAAAANAAAESATRPQSRFRERVSARDAFLHHCALRNVRRL